MQCVRFISVCYCPFNVTLLSLSSNLQHKQNVQQLFWLNRIKKPTKNYNNQGEQDKILASPLLTTHKVVCGKYKKCLISGPKLHPGLDVLIEMCDYMFIKATVYVCTSVLLIKSEQNWCKLKADSPPPWHLHKTAQKPSPTHPRRHTQHTLHTPPPILWPR